MKSKGAQSTILKQPTSYSLFFFFFWGALKPDKHLFVVLPCILFNGQQIKQRPMTVNILNTLKLLINDIFFFKKRESFQKVNEYGRGSLLPDNCNSVVLKIRMHYIDWEISCLLIHQFNQMQGKKVIAVKLKIKNKK